MSVMEAFDPKERILSLAGEKRKKVFIFKLREEKWHKGKETV